MIDFHHNEDVYGEVYNSPGCNTTVGSYNNVPRYNRTTCSFLSGRGGNQRSTYSTATYSTTLPTAPTNGLPYQYYTLYSGSGCSGPSWNRYYYAGSDPHCNVEKCSNELGNGGASYSESESAGGIVCPTSYGLGCTNPLTCTSAGSIKTGYFVFTKAPSATAAFTYVEVIPLGVCSGGSVWSATIFPNGAVAAVIEDYNNDVKCQASSSSRIHTFLFNATYSPKSNGDWNSISYAQVITIPSTGTYKLMYVMFFSTTHERESLFIHLFYHDEPF